MRLIDADEFEKRIKPYDTEDNMDKALYNFAHYHLITTPSAQPEIIRCNECKHRHEAECPMYHEEDIEWDDDGYTEYDMVIHDWTKDDGYCDRGERRTDD